MRYPGGGGTTRQGTHIPAGREGRGAHSVCSLCSLPAEGAPAASSLPVPSPAPFLSATMS